MTTNNDLPVIRWVRKMDPELDLYWRRLFRLTNTAIRQWLKGIEDTKRVLQQDVAAADMERAVMSGDPASVTDRMAWDQAEQEFKAASTPLIVTALQQAGDAEINRLQLRMSFTLDNPYALLWIDSHTAELVTQVLDETKQAIRTVIREAFVNGDPPRKSAQLIRNLVGLTERDARAVQNYWRTVAAEGNRSAADANRMADTYERKLLRRRAENIARTETITAANRGVQLSWEAARDQNLLLPGSMQEWIAAVESKRTCPICLDLDGQRVPLGTPFYSSVSGRSYMGPTAHPSCRCAVSLVTEIPK